MRIVFMGTPDFAVPCLKALLDEGYQVCAVYSQPDKPKGRGYAMVAPPVKELALEYGIPVYQPATLKNQETSDQIASLRPDAIVVVAYGKILPPAILKIPPLGCINVHGSLLPKYRGAAPIQWSIIDGEPVTGVTTMYMAEGLDTGDILLQEETPIDSAETSGELFDRLSSIGSQLLVKTLRAVETGTVVPQPQNDKEACYAPMLSKELSQIDWNKSAQEIHNLVRGLSPWPTASTSYHGKRMKIHQTKVFGEYLGTPGKILPGKEFVVCCGHGTALELLTVQYEGGKKMAARDFLRGHPAQKDDLMG